MNLPWVSILIRFVVLVLLQVLVLKRIYLDYGLLSYAQIFIYPLWVILLPLKLPKPLILIGSFVMGFFIDMFYDSLGVHASALVFSAFVRDFVLRIVEPDIGYETDNPFNLKRLGLLWFVSYAALFLLIHSLFYFSVEVFSYVYFYEIMVSAVTTMIFSLIFVVIFVLIFNPKS